MYLSEEQRAAIRKCLKKQETKSYNDNSEKNKRRCSNTYNLDPDKWYDDKLYMLKSKFKNSEMTESEYEQAVESLDKKYEEMWKRLDGTYQLK